MKARHLGEVLAGKSESRFGRIIVLTGARQTGKTTLAREIFKGYKYISIEDPVTRGDYLRLTASQWSTLFPEAILDEVQKEPGLIESIKSVYDQYETPRYILLGSSQILLLDKVKESLAGRCSIYEVLPLTIPEMLTTEWNDPPKPSFLQQLVSTGNIPALPSSYSLDENHARGLSGFSYYLNFGGYPAIIDSNITDEERREWLNNYIRTYLERDIRDLVNLKELEPFVRIQKTTSILTGSQVNFSQLAREAGIASNTAQRFLRYLEVSNQAFLLRPWFRNDLKRLSKSPKLHYLDPGIQRAILRKQGHPGGNEYESAVAAEIYKQLKYAAFGGDIYHLRTSDGREIDMLIETEEGYIAIEIKMTTRVAQSDARHLTGLEGILDKPLLHSFVLSNDLSVKQLGTSIHAMPAAMFLS